MEYMQRGAALFNERDYNHSTDSAYKDLRSKADQCYLKKKLLSQKSQDAYKLGDKQAAHEYSEQLKQALADAENYSRQAAEYVFRENNTDSAEDEIDLHGLYVKEAEWIVQQRITQCLNTNQLHLKVIVGKGLHSANGVAKLKPAIDRLCSESGLRHFIDNKNTGVLIIDFANSAGGQVPSHWSLQYPQGGNNGPQGHGNNNYNNGNNYNGNNYNGNNYNGNNFNNGNGSGNKLLKQIAKFLLNFICK